MKLTIVSVEILKNRFVERFLPVSDARRLVMLTGARQTSKTTSVRRTYPHLNLFT
ncbi:MAG: hypothetical protein AB1714_05325 [Acidobacteriota bacterium]